MADRAGFAAAPPPDFYIAAIGRSGSTMLCNWLSNPPQRLVFNEPFLLRPANSRLLRIQLASFGMPVPEAQWTIADESPAERFERIMGPRLQGRRWAAKEVLCEEHFAMLETFSPPRVLVCVRNILDVALSLFEKHRLQENMDRYSDRWVEDYCLRESEGMIDFLGRLDTGAVSYRAVRYEDFTASSAERSKVADFVGWPGGGEVSADLEEIGRGFEVERHGRGIGRQAVGRSGRDLSLEAVSAAEAIAERCTRFQVRFGYA